MITMSIISVGMGILGAIINEVVIDNEINLPRHKNGKFNLGIIGNIVIGGFAGWAANDSPLTSFLAGYAGKSFIESLLIKKSLPEYKHNPDTVKTGILPVGPIAQAKTPPAPKTRAEIEQMIRRMANEYGIDPDLAVRVAVCESSLNPSARNVNRAGSVDRGLFQINNRYHPHITDEVADDPEQATRFFCENVKAGRLWLWNASRACWDK